MYKRQVLSYGIIIVVVVIYVTHPREIVVVWMVVFLLHVQWILPCPGVVTFWCWRNVHSSALVSFGRELDTESSIDKEKNGITRVRPLVLQLGNLS